MVFRFDRDEKILFSISFLGILIVFNYRAGRLLLGKPVNPRESLVFGVDLPFLTRSCRLLLQIQSNLSRFAALSSRASASHRAALMSTDRRVDDANQSAGDAETRATAAPGAAHGEAYDPLEDFAERKPWWCSGHLRWSKSGGRTKGYVDFG